MVDPDTASVKIVEVPRLSIARLLDLRAFLDFVLACGLGNEILGEKLMTKHWSGAQWDLFEEPPQSIRLGNIERAKAVEQLRVLLAEAMAGLDGRQETGDDEDHVAVLVRSFGGRALGALASARRRNCSRFDLALRGTAMKPAPLFRPGTLREAIDLLASNPEASALAKDGTGEPVVLAQGGGVTSLAVLDGWPAAASSLA